METTITLEALEALANQMQADEELERTRLHRLITAYARILAIREPALFPPRALEHSDENGHYDNSYPPRVEYKDRRGPRLRKVVAFVTTDIATSSGFYYEWRRETTDRGLYVAPDGELYGCEETGTGSVGQFAVRPGNHGVMCELEWEPIDLDSVPVERLRKAEEELRKLAFPLVAAKAQEVAHG